MTWRNLQDTALIKLTLEENVTLPAPAEYRGRVRLVHTWYIQYRSGLSGKTDPGGGYGGGGE